MVFGWLGEGLSCTERQRVSRWDETGLRYSVCVHSLQEGVCVRRQERLSLVGGGMVKRFRLPSLSCHEGCERQIKLSLSSILSPFNHLWSSFFSLSCRVAPSSPHPFFFLQPGFLYAGEPLRPWIMVHMYYSHPDCL